MAQPDMTAGLDLELDLQLPGGSLSGQVRHAETGRGLGDLVLLCGRERGSGLPHEFVGKTASAADGTFEFAYLHPGRYEVVAISADGLAEERRGVLVVGEERLSGVELELWPGGALVLTIVGSDGPLPNAVVRFQDRSGRWMRFGETQRTSAQGRYAVPGMRAEPWTVLVDAEGYETLIETLSVPLGETLRARLELRRE